MPYVYDLFLSGSEKNMCMSVCVHAFTYTDIKLMWQNIKNWLTQVKNIYIIIVLFFQFSCNFEIFQNKSWEKQKPIYEITINISGEREWEDK